MSSIWSSPIPLGFPVENCVADSINANMHGEQGGVFCIQRLPSEPIGSHLLTLNNVVVGSRVFIRDQGNTTTFYDQVAATSTVIVSLSVYSPGSGLNDLSVKVRKSSAAPKYQPFETSQTIAVGSSSVFIAQVPDTIAS